MSTLKESLEKYLKTKSQADVDLDSVELKYKSGIESMKRAAKTRLPKEIQDYGESLKGAGFAVILSGPGVPDFVKLATDEADVIVVDGSSIYNKIVDRILPMIGGKGQFGSTHFALSMHEIQNIGKDLGLQTLQRPRWIEPKNISGREDLYRHILHMINEGVGTELVSAEILNQMSLVGINGGHDKNTVPVLILGLEEKALEIVSRIFQKNRIMELPVEVGVDKEFVLTTFNNIKKTIKSSKNKEEK